MTPVAAERTLAVTFTDRIDMLNELATHKVRLGDIEAAATDLPPFRLRVGDLTGLKVSLNRFGLLAPPVVWKTQASGGDRWVVIDGTRRVTALQELQFDAQVAGERFPLDSITVAAFEGTLAAAQLLSAVLHLGVAQYTRGDEAVAAWLLESRGWSQTFIESIVDRDQTWVAHSKLFVNALAPSVLRQFRADGSITVKGAFKLAKLVGPNGEPDAAAQEAAVRAIVPAKDRPAKPRGPGRNAKHLPK